MKPLAVDSSVFIDFLRGTQTWAVDRLDRELGRRTIVLGDLVLLEVLQGVVHPKDLRHAESVLAEFPVWVLGGAERARLAASHYRLLRAAGITPRSAIDVLIATTCVEDDCQLLATDRDFNLMAPYLGLDLLEPPLN